MTPEEQRELLARACSGDLAPDEAARLLDACRRDPQLRTKLAELTVVERLLADQYLYPEDAAFVREVRDRLTETAPPMAEVVSFPSVRAAWWRRGAWSVAAVAALTFAAIFWWKVGSGEPDARIVRMESATWNSDYARPRVGHPAEPRRLRLKGGLVELKFAAGATVIVEGPADFEVRGPQQAFLHRGRVVTRMQPGTKGFVLESPRGRVVDQGTEFGVSVGATGDTEVHVLEGKVEAIPLSQSETLQLSVNQAARLMPQHVEQFAADARWFVTDLPPVPVGDIGYLHWPFDEGRGDASHNLGRGLGAPHARAIRRANSAEGTGPKWIAGQFGTGLAFNGNDDYVECEFPGIPGGEPRTVAFWVKVPRDSRPNEGYAIINWGTHQPGLAWQISVNPVAHEGPLGRLRLGVMESFVIGTTDLRDDRWHHCAIVMYGGHRPDAGTHILLYLDGELEPAARKAVGEIRTKISGDEAHNMWIGRNLNYSRPASPSALGRFFRGEVDEVFVFNAALDQEQIRSLMKSNRLPMPPTMAQNSPP